MSFHGTLNGGMQSPPTFRDEPLEHICGNCRTPTGKSAIPCKNEAPRPASNEGKQL